MQSGFSSRSLGSPGEAPSQRPPLSPSSTPQRQILRSVPRPPVQPRLRERGQGILSRILARGTRQLIKDAIKIGVVLLVLYALYLWFTLPSISDARSLIASQSSVIVDRNGTELYRLYNEEDRTFIDGKDIPEHLKKAIVAIEDERFYDRGCLDVRAIARMFFRFGQAGGASTLTRQLARNALDLKRENILNRKLKELILGCQLESHYGKDDLLNLYLNWIPFGRNAYGVELASRTYFNSAVKDLNLAQSAILAALPQRPSYFSPYGKHVHTIVSDAVKEKIESGKITKAAQIPDDEVQIGLLGAEVGSGALSVYVGGRTDQVLQNMRDLGYIDASEHLKALADLRTITFQPYRENIRAPHFVLWVKAQVEELLSDGSEEGILNQGGLTIETTLDWEMQKAAETVIEQKRDDIARLYEAHNIALVAVEAGTNKILTYVGNANYEDEEFDGKVDMARVPRQPGSSFKPIVYAAAFEKGAGPATVLYDVPTKIGNDAPQNFDGDFWGLMNVRRALGASRNIPAIKAYFLAGEDAGVLDMASRLGATTPLQEKRVTQEMNPAYEYGWPLAIGAAETPLTEMVQAYATFANGGVAKPLVSIMRIKDRRGNILFETEPDPEGVQVLDPRIAYEITSVLSDTAARPNEYWQTVLSVPGMQSAAKTGTSNKCLKRDASGNCTDRKPDNLWTMGYTPAIVAGVWIGNADATPLSAKAESLSLASPIWKDFMVRAHKAMENPKAAFAQPTGLVQAQISALSAQLPTECTPVAFRTSDIFLQEQAPMQSDSACVKLNVDRVTGLLASPECPAEAAEEQSFFAPQEVLSDRFPQWQESVLSWAKDAMKSYDPLKGSFSGSVLPLPLAPTESCTLSLTPGRTQKPTLTIAYPEENGLASYPAFRPTLDIEVGSKIREIRATIDDKDAGFVSEQPFELAVRAPRSISEDGVHVLKVTLTDEYYNQVVKEVRFRFGEDSNAPKVRFLSPRGATSAQRSEPLTLEASAEDRGGVIKYVQFFLDDTLLSTKPNAPYTLTWTPDQEPGTYHLRAVATDVSGNKGEDEVELIVE